MIKELQRYNNWEIKLYSILTKYLASNKLQIGTMDCGLFFSECITSMTGFNLAKVKGLDKYSSEKEGYKLLKLSGYGSILDLVDDTFERVPINLAKRGDLCLNVESLQKLTPIERAVRSPMVIVDEIAYSIGEKGIEKLPYLLCDTAWKIG